MLEDVFNWLALLFFVGSLFRALRIGLRARSTAVWFLAGGFVWSVVVRIGISFSLPFFSPHSRSLTLVTAILFYIGVTGLDRASAHFTKRTDEDRAIRDHDSAIRSEAASERDHQADVRDQHADDRDRHADERENGREDTK